MRMRVEEIKRNLTQASALMRAAGPSVQRAVQQPLSAFSQAFQSAAESARSLLVFQGLADSIERASARRLTLRTQLKRKGRPGWKHIKPRSA